MRRLCGGRFIVSRGVRTRFIGREAEARSLALSVCPCYQWRANLTLKIPPLYSTLAGVSVASHYIWGGFATYALLILAVRQSARDDAPIPPTAVTQHIGRCVSLPHYNIKGGAKRALSVARQKPAPLRFRFALVTNGGQTSPLKSPRYTQH